MPNVPPPYNSHHHARRRVFCCCSEAGTTACLLPHCARRSSVLAPMLQYAGNDYRSSHSPPPRSALVTLRCVCVRVLTAILFAFIVGLLGRRPHLVSCRSYHRVCSLLSIPLPTNSILRYRTFGAREEESSNRTVTTLSASGGNAAKFGSMSASRAM